MKFKDDQDFQDKLSLIVPGVVFFRTWIDEDTMQVVLKWKVRGRKVELSEYVSMEEATQAFENTATSDQHTYTLLYDRFVPEKKQGSVNHSPVSVNQSHLF